MADLRIKQINTGTSVYDIDAKYLGGKTYDEIVGLVHGVIDTYVIPTSNSSKTGYTTVVESTEAQISTTTSTLNVLTNQTDTNHIYKVGDIILMGATSDGTKNFDRWVSSVSGNNITLDVLETQVAKHYHTINPSTAKALVSVKVSETISVAKVGTAVTNVITGTSGSVVTSISYGTTASEKGGHNIQISAGTSTDGYGHSHTVNSHSHSVTVSHSTLVSRTVNAYTTLSTSSYTPHKHDTSVTAAGVDSVDTNNEIEYVYNGATATFIKTLTDASTNSTTGGTTNLKTNDASVATTDSLTLNSDMSSSATESSGAHTHTVNTTTGSNVVTSVDLAPNVITSVNYTSPNVAGTVVTGVTFSSVSFNAVASAPQESFFNGCSVNESGVLSFNTASAVTSVQTASKTLASITKVDTSTQSNGSFSSTSGTQSYVSGKVSASGTAESSGAHTHGFAHTHTIPAHSHGIPSHTHTYKKTVADGTGSAYTILSTSSYTPHKHNTSVTAAGVNSDDTNNKITYVYSGVSTNVVRDLKNNVTLTTTESNPGTDTKYLKTTGEVTFPALKLGTTTLGTTSITPAVDNGTAVKSIISNDGDFINSIEDKTSINKGGEPNNN